MRDWLARLEGGEFFAADDVHMLAGDILSARFTDEEKADFLERFHQRGESAGEIAALASAFLAKAEPFSVPDELGPVIDVCGTGGDRLGLFNVSTAAMFVAAGAGLRVVKHGNRGITSRSGGADVLEMLGIPVDSPVEKLSAMLEESRAVMLFAPRFHPSFKAIAPARKILAARGSASVFNMLGPMLNPARPSRQLAGVFAESLLPLYADILPQLGRQQAWVVHGRTAQGGVMDEISTLGPTFIMEIVAGGGTRRREFDATAYFPRPADPSALHGGDASENAKLLLSILAGETRGAPRDIVLLNAAGALQAGGLEASWSDAIERAAESLDSGAASQSLNTMRRIAGGD